MPKLFNKSIVKAVSSTRPTVRSIQRDWYVLDASKEPLGRLASKAVSLIVGKNKANYSPDVDMGGVVVIINAEKTLLTGKKAMWKTYFRHKKKMGLNSRNFQEQMSIDPTKPIYLAIKRMLPTNRQTDNRINNRVKIFPKDHHGFTQKLIESN